MNFTSSTSPTPSSRCRPFGMSLRRSLGLEARTRPECAAGESWVRCWPSIFDARIDFFVVPLRVILPLEFFGFMFVLVATAISAPDSRAKSVAAASPTAKPSQKCLVRSSPIGKMRNQRIQHSGLSDSLLLLAPVNCLERSSLAARRSVPSESFSGAAASLGHDDIRHRALTPRAYNQARTAFGGLSRSLMQPELVS
jgi:hypothetical protein